MSLDLTKNFYRNRESWIIADYRDAASLAALLKLRDLLQLFQFHTLPPQLVFCGPGVLQHKANLPQDSVLHERIPTPGPIARLFLLLEPLPPDIRHRAIEVASQRGFATLPIPAQTSSEQMYQLSGAWVRLHCIPSAWENAAIMTRGMC